MGLEEALDLSGLGIYVHASEGRIGTGSRHQADGSGTGAEKLGSRVNQHIPDGKGPFLGTPLLPGSWLRLKWVLTIMVA